MKSFYVIYKDFNHNEFEPYDVMPYLIEQYKKAKTKPKTESEFRQFIKSESMYRWWSKCEYEIILADWPTKKIEEKWDIHKQVMMNIDIITDLLMKEVVKNK